ncbi:MAG TPA: hypothetical protein VIN58_21620 [Roseateles sp.]
MTGNEINEGNDIATPELGDSEASTTPLIDAGGQALQAVAVAAGGLAGAVAGAMTAPLAVAAAAGAHTTARAGDAADVEEEDEDEGGDDAPAGGDGDQPTPASEAVGEP